MYDYQKIKPVVFTEDGQRMFLKIRDHVHKVLAQAGAITVDKAMDGVGGDAWERLACVHRLEELGEIQEVTKGQDLATQNRVYVPGA